jgi:chromosome segregation ATPase
LESESQRPLLTKRRADLEQQKRCAEQKRDDIFERVRGRTEGLRLEMEEKQKQLIPLRHNVNECQQRLNTLSSEHALCRCPDR